MNIVLGQWIATLDNQQIDICAETSMEALMWAQGGSIWARAGITLLARPMVMTTISLAGSTSATCSHARSRPSLFGRRAAG
jgi:hypothetical protein